MLGFYVNDILDLAQINHGKFRKDCRPVDVKLVIEEVISILQNKADQGQIGVSLFMVGFPMSG
jgi:signal transduction histidine kinase